MVNLERMTDPEWEAIFRRVELAPMAGGPGEEDGAGSPWLTGERGVV